MSEPIHTLLISREKFTKPNLQDLLLWIEAENIFKKPMYVTEEVSQTSLFESSFPLAHAVNDQESIQGLALLDTFTIQYTGLNISNPVNQELMYDFSYDYQDCAIHLYFVSELSTHEDALNLGFYLEFSDNTKSLLKSNFLILLKGKTAPYTDMIRDSYLWKKLSSYGEFELIERNF